MAANSRSAALAYRIGSPRHDSRYSAIDMSVSLRASKDLANALNRESLYMISLLIGFALPIHPSASCASGEESATAHGPIGQSTDFVAQCTDWAAGESLGGR